MLTKRTVAIAVSALLLAVTPAIASAQDDAEAFTKELMEKVNRKLEADREKILKEVKKILEEEIGPGTANADEKVKEFVGKASERIEKHSKEIAKALAEQENYLKHLEGLTLPDQWADVKKELIAMTRAVIAEHKKLLASYESTKTTIDKLTSGEKPPAKAEPAPPKADDLSIEEAAMLFEECLDLLKEKQFDESIRGFKRISDAFPDNDLGVTSAYNVACGYALKGEKETALDWLEKSVKMGFTKFDHIRQDSDLDSLRSEPRYKEIMKRETN